MRDDTSPLPAAGKLPPIELPPAYGYVAAFLTLRCNLACDYCINDFAGSTRPGRSMTAQQWLAGLNRLRVPGNLPVTLQGGEPTLHEGFYDILAGLRADLAIDLLTNLQFDVEEFMARVPPHRLRRDAPYASVRVSYHPRTMDFADTIAKVRRLLDRGYSVGVWGVLHPSQADEIEQARRRCLAEGIDFRCKEFLGRHEGRLHGTYKYPQAVSGRAGATVQCRTSELIIGPGGDVFRCHGDLYDGRAPIGHILDGRFAIDDMFRPCESFGLCNPCDVKVKTNRFQEFGHTSVEIRRGQEAPAKPR